MRFFASVLLFVSTLFGCNAEFGSCLQKVQDLHVNQKDALVIPLQTKTLVFSTKKLTDYLLYDPFLNLYIFKSLHVKYPFKWNKYLKNKELAAINDEVVCGKIVQDQKGLDYLGRFSKPVEKPAIIVNGCCELVALNTPKGIIQKRYLQRFLSGVNSYGDIGVRVVKKNNKIVVHTVNKLIDSPFERGDIILKIDNKKISSLKSFEEKVLFAPVGKVCKISVLRNGKTKIIQTKVFARKGGGFICDTFFEVFGVYIDKDLKVIRSSYESLHVNDKIFMINKQKVQTQEDVRKALSDVPKSFRIGLNRNGLDIFIKIKTQDR